MSIYLIVDAKGVYPHNLDQAIAEQEEYFMSKTVFVFGSNEAGIHGAGAAKTAYEKYGARWGKGYGHYEDSFAIPTKDLEIETLPIARVRQYVEGFLAYAAGHRKLTFKVSRLGCGLAGFKDADIAPLFINATTNCEFDDKWKPWLRKDTTFWGTF